MNKENFESLSSRWSESGSDSMPPSDWKEQMETYNRKWKRSRMMATLSLGTTVVFFFVYPFLFPMETWYGFSGILILIIDMIIYLGILWRRQLTGPSGISLPMMAFARESIQVLKARLLVTEKVLPVYMLTLLAGINLTYLEVLARGSFGFRLSIHVAVSVAMIVGGYFLYRNQRTKIENKTIPMLKMLEEMTNDPDNQ